MSGTKPGKELASAEGQQNYVHVDNIAPRIPIIIYCDTKSNRKSRSTQACCNKIEQNACIRHHVRTAPPLFGAFCAMQHTYSKIQHHGLLLTLDNSSKTRPASITIPATFTIDLSSPRCCLLCLPCVVAIAPEPASPGSANSV